MDDGGKTRKELLLEVERLQSRLTAAERDHQIVVDGLREEHRLDKATWLRQAEVLEAKLAELSSDAHPPLSWSPEATDLQGSERQCLLDMVQNQAEELQASNEELTVQTEELQAANEELTVQAEELRISNEELSAQAEILAQQKNELEHLARELETERTLLKSVLEQMPAGVVIGVAPDGPLWSSNQLANQIWDEPLQDLSGLEAFWRIPRYHPDGRAYRKEEMPLWRSLTQGEVVLDEEFSLRPKGRPPIYLSVSSAPIRDNEGLIVAGVVTHFDITQRKRVERALLESHKRTIDILESISDGFFSCDQNMVVTYFNSAAAKILGRDGIEVLGRRLFDAFPEARGSMFEEKYTEALRDGRFLSFETYFEPMPYRNWYEVRVFPYEGGISVYFQVTTERKEMEEALKRSHNELEQRVRERTEELRDTVAQLIEEVQERQRVEESLSKQAQLLELAQEAIIVRDLDSRVVFWNRGAEETYGWPREQAMGQVTHTLLQTRFPTSREEVDQDLFQTGQWYGELVHCRADGEEIVAASRMVVQRNDDGVPMAILEVDRDVTARRRVEEALKNERQRLLSVLERIPAHVALLRPDHGFAYVNGEFIRRFGEPGSKRCYEVAGKQNPCEECQAIAVFQTGKPVVWEWAGPNGHIYQMYDYPFIDMDGSPLVLEMGVDITARKRAEDALEAERQRFYSVLERIPAYVALISPECTIPYANREFIKRFGDPGNRQCYEFLFGLDEPCAGCKALEVFKTNTPALWEWPGPDGNTYQIYDYPFIDVDGSPLVLEMGVDITVRKRTEEQVASLGRMYRMLSKANEAIVRVTGKDELFRRICRLMMEEGDFRLAWIGLVDQDTGLIKAATKYDLADEYVQNISIPVDDVPEGRGPTGTAAREGRYDVCNDIATDPRMAPWREAALARGFQSSAAFPLRVGSEVVGVLTVYAGRPGFFTADEIVLLESLAEDLSFALEFLARDAQRRLVEEILRESEERLRYLTSQLLHAQEKERRYLALELHDDLGQSLMVLKMQLRAIEKTVPPEQWRAKEECVHCLDYLNGVIDNVRRLARNLRPSVLDDLGLAAGLRVLGEEFCKYHEIELSLEMDDIEGLFSRDEEINLYRIFQETLTNIAKHAQARKVSIIIRRSPDGVSFQVADDGVGFDLDQVLVRDAAKKGLGLAALEERMHILGGALTIKAQEHRGTEVSFTVPRTETKKAE
ncbi:MAG: PAS domain-containing protein [Desulfobaccales bacterium]